VSDIVIDTNVWVMADRTVTRGLPIEEENCIRVCRNWLQDFVDGDDRLVVDWQYAIISEYRRNISSNGFAVQMLNALEPVSHLRFTGVFLDLDSDDNAILPEGLTLEDPADRKFVAAAIGCDPHADIYNATDTDWSKERHQLTQFGLTIHELCPDYIEQRMLIR